MNVQAEVRQVVHVLGGHEPDDFADFPPRKMTRQAGERLRADFFLPCQLAHVIQRGALGFAEKLARPIALERVKLGLVHGRLDGECAADVHAEEADIDARHLFTNQ